MTRRTRAAGAPRGCRARRDRRVSDREATTHTPSGTANGFYYSEHRTVDSKRNVIVNVHVEAANINDVTPMPEILDDVERRLGKLPKYMGLDADITTHG